MNAGTAKLLLVAVAAGALGVVASLVATGPGPLLRSEPGQRLLGTVLSAGVADAPADLAVAQRDKPVPAFKLRDLAGNVAEIPGAYRGRAVLINLWASWCGPCIKEMPELQRFSAEQGTNGVQVVGIALDDPTSVQAFLRRVPVDYPILLDAPGPRDAGVRLGNPTGVLPYSVLVSADGRLLRQRIGPFAPGEITSWTRQD